ncbi:MAG: extracellular solute-binding protein [bacterium]
MSKFQIILLSVFGVFIVVAVVLFSFARGGSNKSMTVVVWGDIPAYDFNNVLNSADLSQDNTLQIKYAEKNVATIESDFTEALATGSGPDLIIFSLDMFWKNRNKILPIPYGSVSDRDFRDTFIEEGELFLGSEGIYALPLSVDPLVLYYNRDLLTKAGIAKPLAYWDEIYATTLKLTEKDAAGNITKSTLALGEARNITHAKDILSLLILQAGAPITQFVGEELRPALSGNFNLPTAPADSALDFYTQFSNPAKPYYSWNRSLLPAETHFVSGDSAYYLGYASELRELRTKNPTLNLGVASVPQSRVSGKFLTLGYLRGVAISRGTKNATASLTAALKLVSRTTSLAFSQELLLPAPRRDILEERPSDAILSVFYDSALQSKGWIDPDNVATGLIFREMIESITSGRARTSEATSNASRGLEALIK